MSHMSFQLYILLLFLEWSLGRMTVIVTVTRRPNDNLLVALLVLARLPKRFHHLVQECRDDEVKVFKVRGDRRG
jgi:hypothetical protein